MVATVAIDHVGTGGLDVGRSPFRATAAIYREMPDWDAWHIKWANRAPMRILGPASLDSSGQLTTRSQRRILDDEDIQMFDNALIASSKLLHEFTL